MQEQITRAMGATLREQIPAGVGPAGAGMPGKRILAAMIQARDSGCACESCGLLRKELDDAIGSFLKQASEATGQPEADTSPPVAVESSREVERAPSYDPA